MIDFAGIDKESPTVDIAKMQDRGLIDPIIKEEGDVEGDNLLLQPEKLKPTVPVVFVLYRVSTSGRWWGGMRSKTQKNLIRGMC